MEKIIHPGVLQRDMEHSDVQNGGLVKHAGICHLAWGMKEKKILVPKLVHWQSGGGGFVAAAAAAAAAVVRGMKMFCIKSLIPSAEQKKMAVKTIAFLLECSQHHIFDGQPS